MLVFAVSGLNYRFSMPIGRCYIPICNAFPRDIVWCHFPLHPLSYLRVTSLLYCFYVVPLRPLATKLSYGYLFYMHCIRVAEYVDILFGQIGQQMTELWIILDSLVNLWTKSYVPFNFNIVAYGK